MGFNDFRIRILLRTAFLACTVSAAAYFLQTSNSWLLIVLLVIIAIIQIYEIYYFVTQTNRRLTKFLESIKYSDFISGFSSGNKLGKSFKELNTSFNEVLDAFRKARSEKEEHWQYLNTVVEHVSVGVISFDGDGNVGLINAAAKKLTGRSEMKNIEELIEDNSRMYKALFDLQPGKSNLYQIGNDLQLSLRATEIVLAGIKYKLVALQNIQTELQKKELEAWQNLTRILRHEIMNSITPIASLTSTLKDILIEEATDKSTHTEFTDESVDDLKEGLITIESRSKGLIKFINAYRDYTTIPLPDLKMHSIKDLIEGVVSLEKAELEKNRITIQYNVTPEDLKYEFDEEQLGQVLINLIKNSIEATKDCKNPSITIKSGYNEEGLVYIQVEDNGKGIIREALDKIFFPFYTTKSEGSGIGLALSRQILQLHNGTLTVNSEPGVFTRFTLLF